MSLDTHAEVLKLTRELQAAPGSLDGLAALPADQLRELRGLVGDALHDAHRHAFQRAAAASALLPTALTARLAQTLIGPYLAARIAAEMPADRSVKLAGHLEVAFLADVCLSLDPARVAGTVRGMPDDRVLEVGMALLARQEYVTLGKFVDVVRPSVLEAMSTRIDDPAALLHIAAAIEARHRLDDLMARVDDDRLTAMIVTAASEDRLAPMLTLLTHMGDDTRDRLAALAAGAGPEVVHGVIRTAHAEDAWVEVLPLLARLDDHAMQQAAAALRQVPEDDQHRLAGRLVATDGGDVAALLGLLDRVPEAADLPVVVALRGARGS